MKYTVLKFSAEWCGPCKAMTPIFDKVKNEFSSDEIEIGVYQKATINESSISVTVE